MFSYREAQNAVLWRSQMKFCSCWDPCFWLKIATLCKQGNPSFDEEYAQKNGIPLWSAESLIVLLALGSVELTNVTFIMMHFPPSDQRIEGVYILEWMKKDAIFCSIRGRRRNWLIVCWDNSLVLEKIAPLGHNNVQRWEAFSEVRLGVSDYESLPSSDSKWPQKSPNRSKIWVR